MDLACRRNRRISILESQTRFVPPGHFENSPALKRLSLPTSFSCSLEGFYSFAHPHQALPAAPDGLPARFTVLLASDKTTQTRQRSD